MLENTCPIGYRPLYLTGKWAEEHDLFVVVEDQDYEWASQWRWHAVCSKRGPTRKWKWYARRTAKIPGTKRTQNVWLHKELCLRVHGNPPTKAHIIVDHKNGNSLDDRARHNLRWATPSQNRENYNGFYAMQLRLEIMGGGGRLKHHQTKGRKGRKNADTTGRMAEILGPVTSPPVAQGRDRADAALADAGDCPF